LAQTDQDYRNLLPQFVDRKNLSDSLPLVLAIKRLGLKFELALGLYKKVSFSRGFG
jgi:hypothetical protein